MCPYNKHDGGDMRLRGAAALAILAAAWAVASCAADTPDAGRRPSPPIPAAEFWRGVDLSYVNELEDCGAVYWQNGEQKDPYAIFADAGANIVRLRLWHTPEWTNYSTLADVKKSIRRAKEMGMETLLAFHYSDTWADPGQQSAPKAWEDAETATELAARLGDYTHRTLSELAAEGLLPEYVQIGNETNAGILEVGLNWRRHAKFFNAGIRAVRRVSDEQGRPIGIMLHVAKPEWAGSWFDGARSAGVLDFDLIGVSYYPQWSDVLLMYMEPTIRWLRDRFQKDVVIVETAYPWTAENADAAANLLGLNGLEEGYPATKPSQRQYMIDLMQAVAAGGGKGVVYWEPAWISSSCQTLWATGSHWENAALFDFGGNLLEGIDYLQYEAHLPPAEEAKQE